MTEIIAKARQAEVECAELVRKMIQLEGSGKEEFRGGGEGAAKMLTKLQSLRRQMVHIQQAESTIAWELELHMRNKGLEDSGARAAAKRDIADAYEVISSALGSAALIGWKATETICSGLIATIQALLEYLRKDTD